MQHVAIMNTSWGLIPKILSGQKTIESRWYLSRRAPWGRIARGDIIFFKNSGGPVSAKAVVSDVHQFEIGSIQEAQKIVDKYGKRICLLNSDVKEWGKLPRYCILVGLIGAQPIIPFFIDKKGFGSAAAWLSLPNIRRIKKTRF